MVDTYIITLLMCALAALILAIAVFTYKTNRLEHQVDNLIEEMNSMRQKVADIETMKSDLNNILRRASNIIYSAGMRN